MERSPSEIRMDLARGHWALGEHDDAIFCLERIVEEEPSTQGLLELGESFMTELAGLSFQALLVDRLNDLCRRVVESQGEPRAENPNLATSTLAELLEDQGHAQRALQVAEDVLARNPDDERARAVRGRLLAKAEPEAPSSRRQQLAELERWLETLSQRPRQTAQRARPV